MSSSDQATPESVYNLIWKDRVERNGQMDPDLVKAALFDFGHTLFSLKYMYRYLTNGKITRSDAPVYAVLAAADKHTADVIDETVTGLLSGILDEVKYADETFNDDYEAALNHVVDKINELYDRMVSSED